jgi:hypothetical protein
MSSIRFSLTKKSNDSMTTCYFQSSFLFDGQAMQLSFSKVKATVENAIDIYLKKEKENVIAITGSQWTWERRGYTLYEFN